MKHQIRSHVTVALLACAALFAVSCSPKKAEKTVVGKWSLDAETKVTFTKEGKVINEEQGKTVTGDYTFTGGTMLVMTMPDVGANMEFDVSFPSDNEMILTRHFSKGPKTGSPDANTEPRKFTRLPN